MTIILILEDLKRRIKKKKKNKLTNFINIFDLIYEDNEDNILKLKKNSILKFTFIIY